MERRLLKISSANQKARPNSSRLDPIKRIKSRPIRIVQIKLDKRVRIELRFLRRLYQTCLPAPQTTSSAAFRASSLASNLATPPLVVNCVMDTEKEHGKHMGPFRDNRRFTAYIGHVAGTIDMLRHSLGVLTSGVSLSLALASRAMPFSLFVGICYVACLMEPGTHVMMLPD